MASTVDNNTVSTLKPDKVVIKSRIDAKNNHIECIIETWSGIDIYLGTDPRRLREIDEDAITLESLTRVPREQIYPPYEDGVATFKGDLSDQSIFIKRQNPSYMHDDDPPFFLANLMLAEAKMLDKLAKHPHPNLAEYLGCAVDDDRIIGLVFRHYGNDLHNLLGRKDRILTDETKQRVLADVEAAMRHLHSLGMAHNDIHTNNIMIKADGSGVLINFNACAPLGEVLKFGGGAGKFLGPMYGWTVFGKSCIELDEMSLAVVREFVEKDGNPRRMEKWCQKKTRWLSADNIVELDLPIPEYPSYMGPLP